MRSEIGTAFSHNRSQARPSSPQSLTTSRGLPVTYHSCFTLGTGTAIGGPGHNLFFESKEDANCISRERKEKMKPTVEQNNLSKRGDGRKRMARRFRSLIAIITPSRFRIIAADVCAPNLYRFAVSAANIFVTKRAMNFAWKRWHFLRW